MEADAWYLSLGDTLRSWSWKPVLTYRSASFEGDDSASVTNERFDAPMSGGTDTWLQGKVFRRAIGNSNLVSHRLRLFLTPTPKLGVTIDSHDLWADELNMRGGSRPLRELADRGKHLLRITDT